MSDVACNLRNACEIMYAAQVDAYASFLPREANAKRVQNGYHAADLVPLDVFEELGEYHLYDNPSDVYDLGCHVLIGGTFDHMHNGHKKLLTVASVSSCCKVTVGITCAAMLAKKANAHLIEDASIRKARVEAFLRFIAPHLKVNVVIITDSFGPYDMPDLDTIVVSSETLVGARLLNEKRTAQGLHPLRVVAVMRSNAYTLSSSFIRKKIDEQGVSAL